VNGPKRGGIGRTVVHHDVPANVCRKLIEQLRSVDCPRPRLWFGQAQHSTLFAVITELAPLGRDQTIKDGCTDIEALRGFFALTLVLERRKVGEPANFHICGFQLFDEPCIV
jgi:hypothetical protein